ncbi:TonB-dependent receptor family protein [Terriglobus roseus DSM 18391]|uniref:TonB-dependent receptor family protein n=1 Tax=Terriglobus roseus (strain DSM 18391 / NRRL B-41598 / KBS 63) TaxID=926566 RepID=I3ZM90_TERRK|nr:TonB-dependent receptor [Terriglobus roseus]AFL90358.1 TonB-dependent receptor family protein [Terriglobus roseus DSM 18391]
MNHRFTRSAVFGALLPIAAVAVMAAPMHAQDVSGSIAGTVRDASGAAIPNATIKLTNTDRSLVVRTLTTSGSGTYNATALPLGGYTVEVTAPGFSTQTLSGITLHVNDALTINGTLKAGGGSDAVTVTTDQLQINLEDATQAGLINGTQVRELVLGTRNYEQLVGLQPGVSYSGGDQIYIGNSSPNGATNVVNFSVNGGRTSGNAWTVDGADNVDRGSNSTLLTYPSVDAIAEFKTLRGQYSAEFGRSASGQINVVTKSGTNGLHGSAYEFVRNDLFNANDVLNKQTTNPNGTAKATGVVPRGKLRYNDFGYTLGGPVLIPHVYDGRKHKTYFFFSQEIRRVITYKPVTLTGVPTLDERRGVFNVNVCTAVNSGGTCTPGSVSKNVPITSAMARAYLQDIYAGVPQPSTDGTGTLVTAPLQNVFNANQQIGRIDQSFGEKLQVFFRIINDSIPTIEPGGLFSGSGYPGVQTTSTNAPGRIYLGHVTYVITPTLLIDGGYAFSQGALLSDPIGTARLASATNVAAATKLPYQSVLPRVPAISFTGGGTGITTYGPYRDFSRNHNIFLNLTKTLGSHTVHVGVDYNHYNKRENNAAANAGSFTFTNAGIQAGAQSYQQSFANFLTGFVSTFSQASIDVTPDIKVNQIEAYAQDDWKVSPRFKLNLGLRYSKYAQPTDANHSLTTFDPSLYVAANAPTIDTTTAGNLCLPGAGCAGTTVNPNANRLNGISINANAANGVTATSPYGEKVGKSDNLNFAPRVGFAWDVMGNGKMSVRGGYGISYDSSLFGIYEQNIFQNTPFVNTPTISNTTFDNPAAVAANVSFAAPVLRATSPKFRTPYNQQFSLGVQAAIGLGITTDISYVGSHQVHLLGLVDINQPAPGAFAAAKLGTLTNGNYSLTTTNVNLINQIRPYRGYGPINSVQPIFDGNYNSLQISGRKQWKHDSQLSMNYTWSRALTNANADRTGAPQISSLTYLEYGRSAADRTHIFNFNAVFAIPFFYEQKGFVGHLLGGWEISALGYFNSGLPLNVTTSALDPAGVGVIVSTSAASGRPDQVANPNVASATSGDIHNRRHWFNVNAYQAVPAGQYRPGNAQRNGVNGPGWWRVDPGLFRNIRIFESLNLQLRGEAFNIFNHTNPDTVSTGALISTAGLSSTAGNITNYRDKRILQLGAKLVF